jgi:hypothetical protein
LLVYDEFLAEPLKPGCGNGFALSPAELVCVPIHFARNSGAVLMIDDTDNLQKISEEAEIEYPPPAHFDESATANAQPVQPIPTGIALWVERARHLRHGVSRKTRIVVLAVIGGLSLGALGEAMLVRTNTSRADSGPAIKAEPSDLKGATGTQTPADETPAAKVAATELPGNTQSISRSGKRPTRPSARHAPRAYRVAVIR